MDDVLQLALVLAALAGEPAREHEAFDVIRFGDALRAPVVLPGPVAQPAVASPGDPWLGEDKFRHAAASWAAMVFTYAAARTVTDDRDAALAVALPMTAGMGIAKEVVDWRRGGPFSLRDLAADALGAGAAWLFLREVR